MVSPVKGLDPIKDWFVICEALAEMWSALSVNVLVYGFCGGEDASEMLSDKVHTKVLFFK
jgi:hypothetical protein